jgi:hypothetical protein
MGVPVSVKAGRERRDPNKTTAKKSWPLPLHYISSEGPLCVFVEGKKRLKEVSAVDPASWFL